MPAPDLNAYFARVDAELTKMTAAEGRAFLERLSNQWEHRYGEFQRRVDMGKDPPSGVTAFDYVETIAWLDARSVA